MFVRPSLLAVASALALAACSPQPQYVAAPVQQPVVVQAAPVAVQPTVVYQPQPVYANNDHDAVALAVLAGAAGYAIGSYNPRYGYVDHYDMYHHPVYTRTRVTHVTNVTNVTNVRNVQNTRNVSAPAPVARVAPAPAPAAARPAGISLAKPSRSSGSASPGRAVSFGKKR